MLRAIMRRLVVMVLGSHKLPTPASWLHKGVSQMLGDQGWVATLGWLPKAVGCLVLLVALHGGHGR
jgi:hypothetical protein